MPTVRPPTTRSRRPTSGDAWEYGGRDSNPQTRRFFERRRLGQFHSRPPRDCRAVLVLFVVLGGRRDAIARLRLSDIVRDRVGPAPDHRRGLVLMIVPEKALARGEMRAKPIPAEIAMVLDTYVACLDRVRRGRALPASAPLFVRSWQDDRPSATKAWATWSLAGRRRRPCGRPSTAAGAARTRDRRWSHATTRRRRPTSTSTSSASCLPRASRRLTVPRSRRSSARCAASPRTSSGTSPPARVAGRRAVERGASEDQRSRAPGADGVRTCPARPRQHRPRQAGCRLRRPELRRRVRAAVRRGDRADVAAADDRPG